MLANKLRHHSNLLLGQRSKQIFARWQSTSTLHERWGSAVLEAAIISELRAEPSPEAKIDVLMSTGAINLVAMSLRKTKPEFLEFIGRLAEAKGYNEASQWICELYTPYIKGTIRGRMEHDITKLESLGANRLATKEQFTEELSTERPIAGFEGPVDLSVDEMNLFDPETWLKESPTAQKLWKEGS